jgi:hypothetical protein
VIAGMNQRLAQRVLRALVTPERTRAIVEMSELHALGGDQIVDQLVAARLLVVQTRPDTGSSVELVHESLIERWPTLRRWLDEDQEDAAYIAQLAAAAKQWDAKDRPVDLVWRGEAMREAKRWAEQRPRSLGAREQAFLDAVLALERRKRRMRLAILVAAFAILAIIAGGASIAYMQVRSAEERAQAEADRATDALAKKLAEEQRRTEAERRAAGLADDATRLEQQRAKAEAEAQARKAEVKMTAEELAAANAELERKVEEAKMARDKATAAAAEAKRLYGELQGVHAELQKSLAAEKARVKQLEDEKRKLTTELKQ